MQIVLPFDSIAHTLDGRYKDFPSGVVTPMQVNGEQFVCILTDEAVEDALGLRDGVEKDDLEKHRNDIENAVRQHILQNKYRDTKKGILETVWYVVLTPGDFPSKVGTP